jgi:hypothetical protein
MVIDTIAKWTGTTFFISAGFIMSLNIDISKYGFLLFFAGHIVLSSYFWWKKDVPMALQNLFFIPIDILGVYRWFFT